MKQQITTTTTTTEEEEDEDDATLKRSGGRARPPQDAFHRLVVACKQKDLSVIRQILSKHPELLNYHDRFHRNLLHYTAILVLEERKSSGREQPDNEENNEQKSLAEQAKLSRCLDCFRYFIARCEPKLWFQIDHDGLTILHLAVISCNVLLVREILFNQQNLIINKGPHQQQLQLASLVTALDREHHSPLHWAVITNSLECTRLLIDHSGVQLVHQADLNGATPLHYATQTSDYPKYRQQLRKMLKSASSSTKANDPGPTSTSSSPASSCESRTTENRTAKERKRLEQAHQQQQLTTTSSSDLNLKRFGGDGCTSTTTAASHNNLDILDYFAHLPGVNLECRDRDLRTPLLWAASSGNRQAILLLLQSGANYLCQDASKLGPLHCAASHGYTDCLECLLLSTSSTSAASSQINQPDNLNCTPLFYAVLSGNIDCVELLLDRGARHDWQDVKGRSAAHFAALRGQLNTLKLLEARGANLWLANKQGDLPLHYAIKSGRQQVVDWLLQHSPYERAVNAINNTGRAPIHLAILKGNPTMVDFLIRRGANLNQLVKVRDGSTKQASSGSTATQRLALVNQSLARGGKGAGSSYRYETALDMARRLKQADCQRLLEENLAQTAARVLSARSSSMPPGSGNVRSLFDLQTADVASPIGFETSGSSAEPPQDSGLQRTEHRPDESTAHEQNTSSRVGLPKLPARPRPLESRVPVASSESANSSALSQSSVTSLRGVRPERAGSPPGAHHTAPKTTTTKISQEQVAAASTSETHQQKRSSKSRRLYRGGINYHNERINASIKCKLYENGQASLGHGSFPPLNDRKHQSSRYPSAGSLPEQAQATSRNSMPNGQEIITNVNVYTSSPCAYCLRAGSRKGMQEVHSERCENCSRRRSSPHSSSKATHNKTESAKTTQSEASETSSTDATSETAYEESDRDQDVLDLDGEGDLGQRPYLPALDPSTGQRQLTSLEQQQQVQRYLPPSQAYTQHLPVILSAEEERSTSGETIQNQQDDGETGTQEQVSHVKRFAAPSSSRLHEVDHPLYFDRTQRGRTVVRRVDRYRDQARSPVAEYIHEQRPVSIGRGATEARAGGIWAPHQQPANFAARAPDYSQVRAKVDSHRNDSGLSSHYGDELDASSLGGRRSKSWSSASNNPVGQQQRQVGPQHQQKQTQGSRADRSPTHHEVDQSRSCSRQTIIRTRRLSVDSEELAQQVEKSIRKYKQETKLFEELQNLKRSQIRSGRANEALLVKRLAERFRQDVLQDSLIGLEAYHGPYTYQAYELYLYDQLRKLSQSNAAKLVGARVAHKFTYHDFEYDPSGEFIQVANVTGGPPPTQLKTTLDSNVRSYEETRNFLEEDLKADLELQQVINRSEELERAATGQLGPGDMPPVSLHDESIAIEPSGALEDLRVRSQVERQEDQVDSLEGSKLDDRVREHEEQARMELQAKNSSTSSSRRSSVDVEQEKLDKLPLPSSSAEQSGRDLEDSKVMIAEELTELVDKKRQIERQAIDLASAILTDALGNVSRAGSPVGPRKLHTSGDEHEEDGDSLAKKPEDYEIKSDDEGEDINQEELQSSEATPAKKSPIQARGRRRSVVNIGDKIEVIYHSVGIEIDTVEEHATSDDEHAVGAKIEEKAAEDDTKVQDSNRESTAHEQDRKSEAEEEAKEEEEEEAGSDSSELARKEGDEGQEEATHQEEGVILSQSAADEAQEDSREQSRSHLSTREDSATSIVADQTPADNKHATTTRTGLKMSIPTSLRRASSPLEPRNQQVDEKDSEGQDQTQRSAVGRRSSTGSPTHHQAKEVPTSDVIGFTEKVFDGFDLDTLHKHRQQDESLEETKAEREASERPRQKVKSARSLRIAENKLRLPRSRIPKGPYNIYVPVELIRQRWAEVKRHERERRRLMGMELRSSEAEAEAEEPLTTLTQQARGGLRPVLQRSISHAKSQPNLDGHENETDLRETETTKSTTRAQELTRDCSNFTLIYELNKKTKWKSQDTSGASESQVARSADAQRAVSHHKQATGQQLAWCRRRVAKIVDVRTLKRTLSLPESLIYSNDLLKRFSLLKL